MKLGVDSAWSISKAWSTGKVVFLLAVLAIAGVPTFSQTPKPCPNGGPLTLDQVEGLLKNNFVRRFQSGQVATTIIVCHVSFSMDLATLDKLGGEDLPPLVIDALNYDTVTRLSVQDARAEMANIEAYLRASAAGTAPGALPVRAKLETDFQAKRTVLSQKRAQIKKDEFETQAAYQDRVNGAKGELEELEKDYKKQVATYYDPFTSRIQALGAGAYPIAAQSVWENYDADADLLRVQIGGQEYLFSGVVPDMARNFKEHWQDVKVGQRLEDDGTRYLFLADTPQRLLGETPQKIQDQRAAGVWIDAQTGRMWTIRSSSLSMTLSRASEYCSTLRMGGFSDWNLPTIRELESLVVNPQISDPKRRGVKGGITIDALFARSVWGAPSSDDAAVLHTEVVRPWSNGIDQLGDVPEHEPWGFIIPDGTWGHTPEAGIDELPALCFRQSDWPPQPAAPVPVLAPGGSRKDDAFSQRLQAVGIWLDEDTNLMWTIKDSENRLTWQQAADYCSGLRLGQLSGWRLPQRDEFEGVYDSEADPKTFRQPLKYSDSHYYLRGYFDLLGGWYWTAETIHHSGYHADQGVAFIPQTRSSQFQNWYTWDKSAQRALCVRPYQPATGDAGTE